MDREQRVKINQSLSDWSDILFGVPQGSILWSALFNIFICDLFLYVNDIGIASFEDDNTPYTYGGDLEYVINKLQAATNELFDWFEMNSMKANAEKCHLLVKSGDSASIKIEESTISAKDLQRLLGVDIDNKLSFEANVTNLCNKASQKLNAISRLSPFLDFEKKKLLMNAFFYSQFNYCPLVWMCHSRKLNNRINRLHERCLRIHDSKSSFSELLKKDNSSIHQFFLQSLPIELYKVKNGLSTVLMSDIFKLNESERII